MVPLLASITLNQLRFRVTFTVANAFNVRIAGLWAAFVLIFNKGALILVLRHLLGNRLVCRVHTFVVSLPCALELFWMAFVIGLFQIMLWLGVHISASTTPSSGLIWFWRYAFASSYREPLDWHLIEIFLRAFAFWLLIIHIRVKAMLEFIISQMVSIHILNFLWFLKRNPFRLSAVIVDWVVDVLAFALVEFLLHLFLILWLGTRFDTSLGARWYQLNHPRIWLLSRLLAVILLSILSVRSIYTALKIIAR